MHCASIYVSHEISRHNLINPQENKSGSNGNKVSRKSSFHEIQLKFRSLERKQREKKEIERKLEKCLKEGNGNPEWPKSDRDTGYVSRDKSRSRDDFLPDSPQVRIGRVLRFDESSQLESDYLA